MNWLYTAISWVLLRWHDVWSQVFPTSNGAAWTFSIIFLVVTLRLVLFPLFVKQMHSMKEMQKLAPQMQSIRERYKKDKQMQSQATMALYKEHHVNPMGGCLPMVFQFPVFIGLYHVLRHLQPGQNETEWGWSRAKFESAIHAKLFGAPIPARFPDSSHVLHSLGANPTTARVVIVLLLLVSCAATYVTQKHSQSRNISPAGMQQSGTQAQMMQNLQKYMIYLVPVGLLFSGLVFGLPLGVLLYWVTNNVWTMGQQFYIYRRMDKKDAAAAADAPVVDTAALAPKPGQRPTQPKNQRNRPTVAAHPAIADGGPSLTKNPASAASSAGSAAATSPARPPRPPSSGGKRQPVTQVPAKPAPGARPVATRPQRKKKKR